MENGLSIQSSGACFMIVAEMEVFKQRGCANFNLKCFHAGKFVSTTEFLITCRKSA